MEENKENTMDPVLKEKLAEVLELARHERARKFHSHEVYELESELIATIEDLLGLSEED